MKYFSLRVTAVLTLMLVNLITLNFTYAQSPGAQVMIPNIMPPSPDAASLGKYGDIDVDKGTGIPNISVPVYEIKTPRFNLPITLSYDASGVKVDQMASWVGLNWSLNCGGVIARTVVGLPDESGNGFLNMTVPDINSFQFPASYSTLDQWILGSYDFDPDYYFYNFGSRTGKFVFGQDKKPLLISSAPLKIQNDAGLTVFTITDEKGDTYIFQDREARQKMFPTTSPNVNGTSSWYLSQMISADKSDTIKFNYVAEANTLYQIMYSYSQVAGIMSSNNSSFSCGDAPNLDSEEMNEVEYSSMPLRLSSVVFKGGKIMFVSQSGRQDEPGISMLSDIVIYNYDFNAKTYTKLKDISLNHDYFSSTITNPVNSSLTNLNYRLKLTGVVENDSQGNQVGSYTFDYNATPVPPVNNFAQDYFGYYNGKTSNSTLLQRQTINVPTITGAINTYTIGEADRSADATSMQAGVLTGIHYPTKGYTQFSYEPQEFENGVNISSGSTMASAVGVTQENNSTTITAGSYINSTVTVNISNYANLSPAVTNPPNVKIMDLTTGSTIYSYSGDPNNTVLQNFPIQLVTSHQYQLTAYAAGNSQVFATITLNYQYYTGTPNIQIGGGLRVSSIKNYNGDGSLLTTKTYKYGVNESGYGELLSPPYSLTTSVTKGYDCGKNTNNAGETGTCLDCISSRTIYSSSSQFELATLGGSPVAYAAITEYDGDPTTNIGKTIYQYDLFADSTYPVDPNYMNGLMITPYSWRNGQLSRKADYMFSGGQYVLEKEVLTNFFINQASQGQGMKLGYKYIYPYCRNQRPDMYYYFYYPIYTGVKLPAQITENEYDPSGQNIINQKVTTYTYSNLENLFPTKKVTLASTATGGQPDQLITIYKYPVDFSSTAPYSQMYSTTHIWSPVIEQDEYKNSELLSTTINHFGVYNNNALPADITIGKATNTPETRLLFNNYDANGNLLQVSKSNGPYNSYQWGYGSSMPTVKVVNATSNDVFFEGFEDGNATNLISSGHTGRYSKSGNYSHQLSGLDNGSYILSYWYIDEGIWLYQELPPITVTNGTYNISIIAGDIDDVRFYPAGALMTTFTYDPLIGVTSMTDPKGETTYYEYDTFQRLMNVKDRNGNIIKHMDYHYQPN